jgi:hypothetical protein
MSDTDERSCAARGYELARIRTVPDDDPIGFFIVGLFLLPVMIFGLLTAVFLIAIAFGFVAGQIGSLIRLVTG